MNIKNQKVNKSYNIKKSKKNWLELTDEELRKLRTNTVCTEEKTIIQQDHIKI